MADDSKVVPGTEVKFEGGVSLPDALSPPAELVAASPETIPVTDQEMHGALDQYLNYVQQIIKTEQRLVQSPWTHLYPVIPYLRFGSDMGVTARAFPKPEFLSLIKQENPTLAQLLTTNDLGEELPDLCTIDDELPEVVGALGYERKLNVTKEFQELSTMTKGRLDIPWGNFVSLLIADGDVYRKFLVHRQLVRPPMIKSYIWGERRSLSIATVNPLVPPDALEKFVQETGESHVAGFVKDLQSLDNELRTLNSEKSPGKLIDTLYARLKQYHPELTI